MAHSDEFASTEGISTQATTNTPPNGALTGASDPSASHPATQTQSADEAQWAPKDPRDTPAAATEDAAQTTSEDVVASTVISPSPETDATSAQATKASPNHSPASESAWGEAYALEAVDLWKRFGAVEALKGVTLRVRKGTIHGFIGPNGAGKSTTFSIVAGFLNPDRGEVRIDGIIPKGPSGRRNHLGILPQDALLPAKDTIGIALTFYGQLQGMSARAAEQEAKRWIEEVGMSEFWNRPCGTLSHGMQKRIGIAQALMGNPPLVLLDEPTAGLDPKSAHQVRKLAQSINQTSGTTLIISSHNLSELEALCDAVTILDRGQVQADGTMTELTRAMNEVRIQITDSALPTEVMNELNGLWCVHAIDFDSGKKTATFTLAAGLSSPEAGISEILKVLLNRGILISGIAKGQGLEAKVVNMK